MVKACSFIVVAGLLLFFSIGCGDKSTGSDDASLNENAGTLEAHSGNNTPVKDKATATTVGSAIQSQAMATASKAMSLAGSAKKTASASGKINGTIQGSQSGTATASGTYEYNESNGTVSYSLLCTFNNYSEDGQLYIGGQINFDMDMSFNQTSSEMTGSYLITGKIRFNGSYIGSNSFTLDYSTTGLSQTYTYTSTIISDGTTTSVEVTYP